MLMPAQAQPMAVTARSRTAAGTEATDQMRMDAQGTTGTVLTGIATGTETGSVSTAVAAETGMANGAALSVQRTGIVARIEGAQQATGLPLPPCWTSLREEVSTGAKSVGSWTLAALWSCRASRAGLRVLFTSPTCPRPGNNCFTCHYWQACLGNSLPLSSTAATEPTSHVILSYYIIWSCNCDTALLHHLVVHL